MRAHKNNALHVSAAAEATQQNPVSHEPVSIMSVHYSREDTRLRIGDIVALQTLHGRAILTAGGFVDCNVYCCALKIGIDVPPRPRECRFEILPPGEHAANGAWAEMRRSEKTSRRSVTRKLEHKAKEEAKLNEDEATRARGQVVTYGATYELRHVNSGKLLTLSTQLGPEIGTIAVELMHQSRVASNAYVRLLPAFNSHATGSEIHDGHAIRIEYAQRELFLSISPVNGAAPDHKHIATKHLSCISTDATRFEVIRTRCLSSTLSILQGHRGRSLAERIHPTEGLLDGSFSQHDGGHKFINAEDRTEHRYSARLQNDRTKCINSLGMSDVYLHGCDVVRLVFNETGKEVRCEPDPEAGVWCPVFETPARISMTNSLSMWIIVPEELAGCSDLALSGSESRYRFRHLVTGLYLSCKNDNSELVAVDNYLEDTSAIGTLFSCTLMSEIDAAIAHPGLMPDRETYFITHAASGCEICVGTDTLNCRRQERSLFESLESTTPTNRNCNALSHNRHLSRSLDFTSARRSHIPNHNSGKLVENDKGQRSEVLVMDNKKCRKLCRQLKRPSIPLKQHPGNNIRRCRPDKLRLAASYANTFTIHRIPEDDVALVIWTRNNREKIAYFLDRLAELCQPNQTDACHVEQSPDTSLTAAALPQRITSIRSRGNDGIEFNVFTDEAPMEGVVDFNRRESVESLSSKDAAETDSASYRQEKATVSSTNRKMVIGESISTMDSTSYFRMLGVSNDCDTSNTAFARTNALLQLAKFHGKSLQEALTCLLSQVRRRADDDIQKNGLAERNLPSKCREAASPFMATKGTAAAVTRVQALMLEQHIILQILTVLDLFRKLDCTQHDTLSETRFEDIRQIAATSIIFLREVSAGNRAVIDHVIAHIRTLLYWIPTQQHVETVFTVLFRDNRRVLHAVDHAFIQFLLDAIWSHGHNHEILLLLTTLCSCDDVPLTWNQNLIASFVLSDRALPYLFYRIKWAKTEDVLYVQDPRPKLSERKAAPSLWRSHSTLSTRDDTSLEVEGDEFIGCKDNVRPSVSDEESSQWVEICASETNEEYVELNYMCCTLKLFASLCAGRNSFVFKKLLQKTTCERLFIDVGNLVRIIQSPRVPSRLREAACALFDLLYLDREPREITKLPRMTRVSALVDLSPVEMRQTLRFQFKTVDPFRDFPHVNQVNYDDFYFKMLKLLKEAVVPWSRMSLPDTADAGDSCTESSPTDGTSNHSNKRPRFVIHRQRTSLPAVASKALSTTCAPKLHSGTKSHSDLSSNDAECHLKVARHTTFRSNKNTASASIPMFTRRSLEYTAQDLPLKMAVASDQALQQQMASSTTTVDKYAAHIPHYGFAAQLLLVMEKILRFRLLKCVEEGSSTVLAPLLILIIDILDSTRIRDEDNYAVDEIEFPPKASATAILTGEKRYPAQKNHDRLILHNKALSMISLLLDIQLDRRISVFQYAVERGMNKDIGQQTGDVSSSEFSDRHSLSVLYSRMFRESIVAETLTADSEDPEYNACLSRLLLGFSASPNAEVRCHAMMVLLWQLTQRETCFNHLGLVHFVAVKPIAVVYHEVNQGASELRRLKKWISASNEGYAEALKTANYIIHGITNLIQRGTGECSALEALGIVAESNFVDHVANILREPLDVAESQHAGNTAADETTSTKKSSRAACEATLVAINLPAARCHEHLIVLRSIVEFAVAYCQGGTRYQEEIFVHIRLFMSHMGVKHLDMARAIGSILRNNKRLLNAVSDDLIRHVLYLTKHLGKRSRWLKLISELLVCNGKVLALNQKMILNKFSENVDLLNLDGRHGDIPLYFLILQREHFFRYNSTLQYHRVSLQVLGLCATNAVECQLVVHSVMPFTKAVKGYVDCGMPKQHLPRDSHEEKMAVRLEECPKHQISALSIKLSWLQLLTAAYLTCELESLANLVAAYAFPEHFKNQIGPMLDSELGDSYPTMSIFDALVFDVQCCIDWRDSLQAVETDEAASASKFVTVTNAGGERTVPHEWRTGRLIVDYICKGIVPAVLALFKNAYLQTTARKVLTSDIKARLFDALTRFLEACPAEEMTASEFSLVKLLPLSLHSPLDENSPAPLPVSDIRQSSASRFDTGSHLDFACQKKDPQAIQILGMRHWQRCVSNMASFAQATNQTKHIGPGTVVAANFLLSAFGRYHLRYIVVSLRLIAAHLRERRLGIPFPSSIEGLEETDFDTNDVSLEIACRHAERTHFVEMMLNVLRVAIHVRAGATIGEILNGVCLEASSPAATEAVREAISQWQLHTVAIGFLGLTGHEAAALKLLMTLALRGECAQRDLQDAIIVHTRSEEARYVGVSLGIMLLRDCDAICTRQAQRKLHVPSPGERSHPPAGNGLSSSRLLLDPALNRAGLPGFPSRVAGFTMSAVSWSFCIISTPAKLLKKFCGNYRGNICRICFTDWWRGGRCLSRVSHKAGEPNDQNCKLSRIHVEQEADGLLRNHGTCSETADPYRPMFKHIVKVDTPGADTVDTLGLVELFKMLCKHGHEGMQNLMGTPIQLNKKVAFPVERQRTTIVALAVEWFVTLVREPDGSSEVVRLRKIVGILEVIYMLIISHPANNRIVTRSNFLPRVSRLLQAALPRSSFFEQHCGLSTASVQKSAYEYSSHALHASDSKTESGSQPTTEASETDSSIDEETSKRKNVAHFSSIGGTRNAVKRRLSTATIGPTQYSRQSRQHSMRGALPRVQHDLRAIILRITLVMLRGRDGATLVPIIRQCVTERMLAVVMHISLTQKLWQADLLEEGFLACFIKSTLDLHDELNDDATSTATRTLSVGDNSIDRGSMAGIALPNQVMATTYVDELEEPIPGMAEIQSLALPLSSKSMDIRDMMTMYHLEAGVVDILRNGKVERMLFRKHERVIDLESDLRWRRRTLERLRSIPRGEKVDTSVKARAFLDEINKIAREEVALSHTRTAFINSMSCLFEWLPNFVSVLLNAMILLNYQKKHFHELYDAWVAGENAEASSSLSTPTNSTGTYISDDGLDDGVRFRLGSVFERSVVCLGIAYNIIAGFRIFFRVYARFALVVMDCRPHLETLIMLRRGQTLWRSVFEKVYAGLKLLKVIINLLFVPALCIWSSLLGNLVSPAWHACHLLEWSISNRKIQFISQTFINSMSLVVFLLCFSFNCLYITYALIFEHFKYQRIRCASTWQCWYSAAILNTLGNPSSLFWNVDPILAETPQPFGDSIDAAWVLINVVVYFLFSFLIQTLIGTIFFNELSKLTNQEEDMKKDLLNCCLVCSMNRHQFAHKQSGWEKHVEIDHNPMNYVALALTLGFRQHEVHKFTAYEAYVYQRLLEDDASLLPSNVCYKKSSLS